MKRLLLLLILPLYLLTTGGVFFSLHYCAGELASVSLFADSKNCGCNDKEEIGSSCCKDDHFSYRISNSHQTSKTGTPSDIFCLNTIHSCFSQPEIYNTFNTGFFPDPFLYSKIPIYLSNRVLII